MARKRAFACLLAAALAAGCGSDRASRGEGTLEVWATTGPLADIVRNAGGRRVRVISIVPDRANPHGFSTPYAQTDRPDLLVRSGGTIDTWADGLEGDRSLTLLPRLEPLGRDPHWWLDPVRVERAVKEIRNELARADVNGAGYYEAASADYLARLRRLDHEIERCLTAAGSRPHVRLAAQHDAFAYFTDRYGVELVKPGRAATVGRRLWSDTLGAPGSGSDTYLGAMAANTEAIVDALSGGEASCRPRP
jgi:ABC-type Zn uptake system ZnuABC Zn-binding protein ZnuA